MRDRKQNALLLFQPGPAEIEHFVDALNAESFFVPVRRGNRWEDHPEDFRPIQKDLRRFAQTWKQSGFNVKEVFKAEPEMARRADAAKARLGVTEDGRLRAFIDTSPNRILTADAAAVAIGIFLQFLLNPLNERLGGPCAYCEKFFVKQTSRKKSLYCSQLCARRFTSRMSNRKRRDGENREKIARAENSIRAWSKTKTKLSWEKWVLEDGYISRHWLNRAVKNGVLVKPSK